MIEATKRLRFCAAHRLLRYEGPCSKLHGHNYVVEVTVRSVHEPDPLNDVGFVADFADVRNIVGGWIDENWDHRAILDRKDALIHSGVLRPDEFFVLDYNPTAENMAHLLLRNFDDEMANVGVELSRVRVYETETCWAEASR